MAQGSRPRSALREDRHAAATRYHAGRINAQLRIHNALLLHAQIISTVMVSARSDAARNEMWAWRTPQRTPKIPGRRNRNRQSLGSDWEGYICRERTDGMTDNIALAQRVRREIDPTI